MASVCLGRDVAFGFKHSPTILEDRGDGFFAQTDCDTLRFLRSLSSCQVRQGYWIGQATPNRDGNNETSLLWSTGSDTCIVTTATMLADALTKALVHCPSLLAAMNARRHVFVTYETSTCVKTTLPMSSEPTPTLTMAIGSQLIRSAKPSGYERV